MSSKRLHYSDFALTYEFLYGILTRFIVIGHRKVLPSAMVISVNLYLTRGHYISDFTSKEVLKYNHN